MKRILVSTLLIGMVLLLTAAVVECPKLAMEPKCRLVIKTLILVCAMQSMVVAQVDNLLPHSRTTKVTAPPGQHLSLVLPYK